LAGALLAPTAQAAENDLNARVVLFIPEDAEPPEKYQQRLESLAVRTEAFFGHWMKHWKRPIEREQIFARNEDDTIQVTLVSGRVTSKGRAALPEIRKQAVEGAARKLGLGENQPVVWWILYDYPGIRGFQGGSRGIGGIAINAYPKGTDLIAKDIALATPRMAEMAIKGTIHEFGHALGLPHIGPRPGLELGNSLMGPINRVYWSRTGSDDPRVHLTETAAAMLWRHPIFRRESTVAWKMPQEVDVTGLEVTESDDGPRLFVKGKLSASLPAHTAVLLDSERGRFGDYWERSYTGAIDAETGEFKIVVCEPFGRGTLYLSFCFANGVNTSNGRVSFQRGASVQISYSGKRGSRHFDLPR